MVKFLHRGIFCLLLLCICYAFTVTNSTYHLFDSAERDPLAGGKQRLIAILPSSDATEYSRICTEAAAAGDTYGAYVEFFEAGTREEQLQVLQIALDSRVDGVLLYPVEKAGYSEALTRCGAAGISTVVVSQPLEDAPCDTYIGAGQASERMAVLSCITATQAQGRVLLLDQASHAPFLQLEAAVLAPVSDSSSPELPSFQTSVATLAQAPFKGYQVEYATVLQDENTSSLSLYSEVYKLLATQRPDAVFSYDADITGVVSACAANSDTLPSFYCVGYGNLPQFETQIRSGDINGLVVQNDVSAASLAVRYLVDLGKGSIMPATSDSGLTLVTTDNLERMLSGYEM